MKKLLFLLPVLFVAFISCNNKKDPGGPGEKEEETNKSVVGKWKVVEMNMGDMDNEEKEDAERNATVEFRKDGSYTSKDSDGTEDGDYKYDEESSTITMDDGIEFKISWRGKNLVMKRDGGSVVLSRSGSGGLSNNRDDDDMKDTRVTSIAGRWRIADVESPDGEKPSGEELRNIRASTIEFTRDGNYIAVSKKSDGEMDTEYGSYTFDARAKTLETVDDKDNKRQNFDVEIRGRDRMVLTYNEGKITLQKD